MVREESAEGEIEAAGRGTRTGFRAYTAYVSHGMSMLRKLLLAGVDYVQSSLQTLAYRVK